MRPYYQAKAEADAQLEASRLDYTIVRPGGLTDDDGTGRIEAAPELGRRGGIPREDVAAILGDYAKTAPMETFTATQGDRHPTELAGLMGARLVTAQETEQGRRWAESKVKSMTGGDPIAARFMRQDFFEFTPQFKLLIAGNHKPGLRGVDEAIRRRLHLIPFTVTIPPERRDPDLFEKLKPEWPGILKWAIDGCLAWQRDRLTPPGIVREATAAYLAAEDAIAQWLDECCAPSRAIVRQLAGLPHTRPPHERDEQHASGPDGSGAGDVRSPPKCQALEDRGFTRDRGGEGERLFRGLALQP